MEVVSGLLNEHRAALEASAWILLLFETCICVINSHDICVDSVRLTSWYLMLKQAKLCLMKHLFATYICHQLTVFCVKVHVKISSVISSENTFSFPFLKKRSYLFVMYVL